VWWGAAILAGSPGAVFDTLSGYFYGTFANEDFQWIIIVIALIGILVVLFERSKAVTDFGSWLGKYLKTPKLAILGTYLFGAIVFLDDYLSNLTVGNTMRRITDKFRIPRSQFAFIVNLMAGPICVIIPLTSWAAAFSRTYEGQGLTINGNAMAAYLKSVPMIFYVWVILAICLLQIFGVIPKLGMIKKDYVRAAAGGSLYPQGIDWIHGETWEGGGAAPTEEAAAPETARPWGFLVPMLITCVVTFMTELDIIKGCAAGIVVAAAMYLITKRLRPLEVLDACFDGIIRMGFVLVVFLLAYSVQAINEVTGMPAYVISLVEPIMDGAFLPVVTFLICAAYSFFTGTCWDLVVIILPIVVPLAGAIGTDPLFVSASVISGAMFGNIFCPYGDGMILCSQACEIRPTDLMIAIAPYMLIGGAVTSILYFVFGFIL
jgi:Na+/H+ antiporter NhaC